MTLVQAMPILILAVFLQARMRESWWLLAARYYQSDPKAAEVIEKSLELGDKEDLGNILFCSIGSLGFISRSGRNRCFEDFFTPKKHWVMRIE